MKPHWHILGVGAIGGLFARRLSEAGHGVTLLAREGAAGHRTLRYIDSDGEQSLEFAQESIRCDAPIPHLLVTIKAQDILSAVDTVLPRITRASTVLLLANGMGYHHAVLDALPGHSLLVGITSAGCHCPDRDTRVAAGRGTTQVGEWKSHDSLFDGSAPDGSEPGWSAPAWIDDWLAADWDCQWRTDIEEGLIQKLAINCAINPATALLGVRNGELLSEAHRPLFDKGIREIAARLRWAGWPAIARSLPNEAVKVATQTADNTSSMLSDVRRRRTTEVDFLLGYLLEQLSDRNGQPAPASPQLQAWLNELRQREPGRE